ncbi:PulJ/GspJ family protein [Acinetobacter terrestris]|uniref:PulJ/GspJ family protein n=1 Tax=Acinetobacter terrestris TaxID=2529843 RepID=UPI0013F17D73|nr:type II secretion system protein [Acinetobacter terrestris]
MHQIHYKTSAIFKHQQGVTLIEVLVSMLLMAIIGLGAAFISGRTAVMHRDQNIHLHTINQMREYLERGVCPDIESGKHYINVAEMKVAVECSVVSKTYEVHKSGENTGEKVKISYPTLSVIEPASKADVGEGVLVPSIPVKISP